MTITAVKLSADKGQTGPGQVPLWPDNEDLAFTTSDSSFFDQFLTFDPADATAAATLPLSSEHLEDPPSPSILLDSLDDGLEIPSSLDRGLLTAATASSSSSSSFDTAHAGEATTVDSTTTISAASELAEIGSDSIFFPFPKLESDPLSALPTLAGDPILSSGSISDSELLRLEGISTTKPAIRGNVTAPSTPLLAASASAAGLSRSPRKPTRFLESLYNTIRRGGASHRRPKLPVKQEEAGAEEEAEAEPLDMTSLDMFLGSDRNRSGLGALDLNHYDEFSAVVGDLGGTIGGVNMESLEYHGLSPLPLTPPLTRHINANEWAAAAAASAAGHSGFVAGHLDDPFLEDSGGLAPSAILHSSKRRGLHAPINTPMDTPMMDAEASFCHGPETAYRHHGPHSSPRHPQHPQHRHKAYRHHKDSSSSSAQWPSEGVLTNRKYSEDSIIWSPGTSFVLDTPMTDGPNWWDDPNSMGDEISSGSFESITGGKNHHPHPRNTPSGNGNGRNLSYEQGLGIHMPQPRAPPPSILSANIVEHGIVSPRYSHAHHHALEKMPSHSHLQQHPHYSYKTSAHGGHGHAYFTDRRPRPRAPSSGARHHGHNPMASSPRRLRHSVSLGALREQPMSPSPVMPISRHGHGHHPHGVGNNTSHQERRQQRSSSLSMRKQRSFSRRSGSGSMSMSMSSGDVAAYGGRGRGRGDGTSSSSSSSTALNGGHNNNNNNNTVLDNGHGPTAGSSSSSSSSSGGRATAGGSDGRSGGSGSGGAGGAKFVNYTPNDKKVLMTGVAPSGSSKTKARREKEAEEKRQQLERENENMRRQFLASAHAARVQNAAAAATAAASVSVTMEDHSALYALTL
ncbi:hypothetical protein F5Y17DRAFT_428558 [Xylariaceae sp. FL0594]|nr:hypothetical protein F5Y17DRAFT_428558 [Xylariaceae sp. FL0594]